MTLNKLAIKRVVTASAVTASVALSYVAAAQQATLNGAGATFPEPLYQRYSAKLRQENPSIQMNYQELKIFSDANNICTRNCIEGRFG